MASGKAYAVEQRLNGFIGGAAAAPFAAVALDGATGWSTFAFRTWVAMLIPAYGLVWMSGQISPGTTTDGTRIGTVGAGYRPANRPEAICVGVNGSSRANTQIPYIEIQTNGNVLIESLGGSGGHITINGAYPLNAPAP